MDKCLVTILVLSVVLIPITSCPVVNCGTTSPVSEGQPSRIICYFVHDLRLVKTDFSIHHYAEPPSVEKPEMVLDCYYRDENSAYPECTTAEGYTFNGEFGTTVTLDIANTSKSHDGNYVCQTTAAGFQRNRVCALHVKSKEDEIHEESKTSCRTNTPVVEGEPSFIECNFTEDPQENRHYFNIIKYDVDEETSVPKVVLDCVWHIAESQPECHVEKGYAFNYVIGSKLNLTIPRTTTRHAGKYACEDSPTLPSKMMCCSQEVLSAPASSTTTPGNQLQETAARCVVNEHVTLGESTTLTCLFPEDLDVSSKFVNVEHQSILKDGTVSPLTDQVLHCAQNSKCYAKDGYEFHGAMQANFTIDIPVLSEDQLGKYVCKVFEGNEEIQSQDCFLSLSQGHGRILNTSNPGNMDADYMWIIIILLILIILVLIITIVCLGNKKVKKNVARMFRRARNHPSTRQDHTQNRGGGASEGEPLRQNNTGQKEDGCAEYKVATHQNGNLPNGDVELTISDL